MALLEFTECRRTVTTVRSGKRPFSMGRSKHGRPVRKSNFAHAALEASHLADVSDRFEGYGKTLEAGFRPEVAAEDGLIALYVVAELSVAVLWHFSPEAMDKKHHCSHLRLCLGIFLKNSCSVLSVWAGAADAEAEPMIEKLLSEC